MLKIWIAHHMIPIDKSIFQGGESTIDCNLIRLGIVMGMNKTSILQNLNMSSEHFFWWHSTLAPISV